MSIDEAIEQIQMIIKAASPSAENKVVKISDEEARISVYAPAGEIQAVKDATFQPLLDLLIEAGCAGFRLRQGQSYSNGLANV